MKENDHCYYVASRYLGQIELSIEALRKVDNDELLSIPFFYEPLFNLIMAGLVSKLEEFLKDRLELEVYASNDSLYKYASAYIELIAQKHGCSFVDLYTPLFDLESNEAKPGYTLDGAHLSEEGYEVITSVIKPVLEELL